jgi:hypothetical protein
VAQVGEHAGAHGQASAGPGNGHESLRLLLKVQGLEVQALAAGKALTASPMA